MNTHPQNTFVFGKTLDINASTQGSWTKPTSWRGKLREVRLYVEDLHGTPVADPSLEVYLTSLNIADTLVVQESSAKMFDPGQNLMPIWLFAEFDATTPIVLNFRNDLAHNIRIRIVLVCEREKG